jgi:alpha-mannosidase
VRASVRILSTYHWPERADERAQSREGERRVEVTTDLEIRADERAVRVATSFVNPCCDHRLRVHLPLPELASASRAECAFGLVTRGLSAEGRPEELGLPTFPARRFVAAGGITVVHEGVCEYELVDLSETSSGSGARTLALTVLRSTGMLSRLGMAFRPLPAGPLIRVDGLQLLNKPITFRYALAMGEVDPFTLADDILLPLDVVWSSGGGSRPASGSALCVDGAEVTAVRRVGDDIEVRLFNPGDAPTTVDLGAGVEVCEVDFRGRALGKWRGPTDLRAFGIATLRVASP